MKHLLEWLYPPYARCLCCGEPRLFQTGEHVCGPCLQALQTLKLPMVPFAVAGIEKVYAPFPYDGAAENLVRCLKFSSVRDAAEMLGREMAVSLWGAKFDAVVPVPLFKDRQAERGFNQAELLALVLGEHTGMPVELALKRLRKTRQQAKLKKEKRLSNLQGAFGAEMALTGKKVLLIDDVSTTGGTATACAKALHEAGAQSVSLCVAAVTLKAGRA